MQPILDNWAPTADDFARELREVNDALLVSSVRQHELTEAAEYAQVALRESARRFREMIDALPAAVYTTDAEGLLTHFNRACVELSGRTPQLGTDHWCVTWKIFYPDGRPMPHDECPMAIALTKGRVIRGAEMIAERPDGTRVWFTPYPTPLCDESGTIVGGINMLVDITERKQAEAARRESEERFRTLFEVGPVAAYSCDVSGVIQQFNHRAAELWGRAPALGDTDERFCGSFRMIRPDGSVMAHEQCPMAEVLNGTIPLARDAEVRIDRPDGSRITVVVNIRPLKNEQGEITGAINCFYDITERKEMEQRLRNSEERIRQQAEQLADESRRKDEFLAMLSHELRNPLAPIQSAVHLLNIHETGSENLIQKQAHQIIERQVANLTKLVSDLLEVSRVISGRIRLDLQPLDMNQVIRDAIETVRPLVENRKHELVLTVCSDPVWANADATRIEEVFVNLLNNAAKYTDKGGRIEVGCEREQDYAQVRIRDNGVGIDEKLLPRIFDLFTQADRSLDRAAGGLGIGLSLAHRIVELHGGVIEAHSPPAGLETGSEFVVRLPAAPAPDMPPPAPGDVPQSAEGLRVLVVDDNIDLVMMLVSSLQNRGYSVQSAYTGTAGLKAALQWRPDVVLLDIGLPEMDGYEVARRLRSDPSLCGAPEKMRIFAMTGYGRDSDISLAREAGFDAHMTKPCDFHELEKLLAAPRR